MRDFFLFFLCTFFQSASLYCTLIHQPTFKSLRDHWTIPLSERWNYWLSLTQNGGIELGWHTISGRWCHLTCDTNTDDLYMCFNYFVYVLLAQKAYATSSEKRVQIVFGIRLANEHTLVWPTSTVTIYFDTLWYKWQILLDFIWISLFPLKYCSQILLKFSAFFSFYPSRLQNPIW